MVKNNNSTLLKYEILEDCKCNTELYMFMPCFSNPGSTDYYTLSVCGINQLKLKGVKLPSSCLIMSKL